jgi:diguanylate cyclase (GGDEF)-like protein/PAS domain S-box-containing protein
MRQCAGLLLGAAALAAAVFEVAFDQAIALFEIAFGVLFAALSARFAVRLRDARGAGGAAELFMFLLLLVHGTGAAVIAAAAAAAGSSGAWRKDVHWIERWSRPAAAATAMFACGWGAQVLQSQLHAHVIETLSESLRTCLNALFVATAYLALKALLSPLFVVASRAADGTRKIAVADHASAWLTYCAAMLVAVLLQSVLASYDVSVVLAAAPLIVLGHSAMHLYAQRMEERVRLEGERARSAEQNAANVALHLKELEESEERFQSAFKHAAIGMALVAPDGRIVRGNGALAHLLGRTEPELVLARIGQIVHAADLPLLQDALRRTLGGGADKAVGAEVRCHHRSGAEVWVSVSGSSFTARGPHSRCIILQLQDITARRSAEARLQHIAHHDSLTDLANRACFMEQLARSIEGMERTPDAHFAVLFLDFDRFKLVNDSLGHGAGDALLHAVAERLRDAVRGGDLVARFGGDEFALLIHRPNVQAAAAKLAAHLLQVIAKPVQLDGVTVSTSASIGIAISDAGYRSPDQMVRDADTAMYRAKRDGKARFVMFDRDLHAEVAERLWLEEALRRAVAGQQLELNYQPIFDLATRKLGGFEALCRWRHPDRGSIAPDLFIRIAEETGLIIPLGTWVLNAACHAIANLSRLAGEPTALAMHVNVSGIQLAQPGFVAVVRDALKASAIEPRQLVLEVTESVLIDKRSPALAHLHELRTLGVGVSIDDFGTGYSCFSMLFQLPVDEIKIDKSFVQQMVTDERGLAVVETLLALGRTLGKIMLAEGIETEEQLERLAAMGCGSGQGYLLGCPLDAIDAATLACACSQPSAPPGDAVHADADALEQAA